MRNVNKMLQTLQMAIYFSTLFYVFSMNFSAIFSLFLSPHCTLRLRKLDSLNIWNAGMPCVCVFHQIKLCFSLWNFYATSAQRFIIHRKFIIQVLMFAVRMKIELFKSEEGEGKRRNRENSDWFLFVS